MFRDYSNAVVGEYQNKVASNKISLNLTRLTPGKVKRECKAVCKMRFRREDEQMLSAVFGFAENVNGYLQAIGRYDIDKFRPMINFIEGRSKETDERNVELLAWLIDFRDRPFNLDGKYGGANLPMELDKPQVITDESPIPKNDPRPLPFHTTKVEPTSTRRQTLYANFEQIWSERRVSITALVVALFAWAIGYFSLNSTPSSNKISNNDSCMYWKDDRYVRISCGQKMPYSKVIALDPELLNNFRKITMPDTLTYNSLDKVWYIKINGEPEFYTDMGYHPIFMQLQLKPISKYIIDNYLRSKTPTDSLANPLLTTNISADQPDDFKFSSRRVKVPSPGIYGQCQALTKKKTRCSRNAERGGFCWQHKKQGA